MSFTAIIALILFAILVFLLGFVLGCGVGTKDARDDIEHAIRTRIQHESNYAAREELFEWLRAIIKR